jgi:alpha-1,3-rhamnosyl/mannosyltransferase
MTARVGVNLLWMVPGVVGGSEDATIRLLCGIAESGPAAADVELVLFVLPSFATAHPDLADQFRCVVAPVDGTSKPRRVLAESTWLPRAARRAGVDLTHHAGGVVPPGDRGRTTVTVHDLQPLDLPGNFAVAKRAYLSALLRPTVRRAAVVAVPSAFTRARVVDRLGADPDRVVVVPWSAPAAPPPGSDGRAELPATIREHPFVLYPAITYPHKNHAVLLDAFATAALASTDLRLVLIGGHGRSEAAVAERMARPDLAGRVVRLGRVADATRDALVAAATIVAVPSRYEGFGLPALEAMAAGVPVVVADAGSLPEVVAPDTPVVDPDDVPGWAAAIGALADDPARRAELAAAGRRRAAELTAARSAAAMLDVWRRALESRPPHAL